jgi:hypothetical protein
MHLGDIPNYTMTHILTGAWQIISWQISYSDNRAITEPFGHNPTGLIIYADNGWMSVSINSQPREVSEPELSLRQRPYKALAQAYKSYFHYAGTYEVEGNDIYHHVTQSLNPDFVGSVQKRKIELNGNKLTLTGIEKSNNVLRTHTLSWQATF